MTDGRTIWRAKDALWHEREWIVTLVEEFGPAGYAIIDYLEAQAKMQNDGGRVKTGPRAIARATGAELVTVGHVVSRSVTLGLLDEYEDHDGRFTCRIAWFAADQGRATAANRKARQRDATPVDKGDPPPLSRSVTPSHAESRPVTESHVNRTGQDSTSASQKNINAELRSAVVECFAYWQERCGHQQAAPSDDRLAKIRARLVERQKHHGGDLSAAIRDVRQAIDGAAIAPFIDERGKRHDGIDLIFRNNGKLEDFMGRALLAPVGNVVPITGKPSPSDLLRAINGGAA